MKERLPLAVFSGYLGAGKTTLINRLLAEPLGIRVLVMVNDFGAINIDAELLADASDDTLTLTNGCVCCTMGADLSLAINDVLDRAERPDHLIIEASGIADPARIAQVARAEPDLAYGGIVTVVDGPGFAALAEDARIGAQIEDQVRAADLVCVSRLDAEDPWLMLRLRVLSGAEAVDLRDLLHLAPLLLASEERSLPPLPRGKHPAYVGWQSERPVMMSREALMARLDARPDGLFRFKGFVAQEDGPGWEVHVVGPTVDIRQLGTARKTQVVGIGLGARITAQEIADWWEA